MIARLDQTETELGVALASIRIQVIDPRPRRERAEREAFIDTNTAAAHAPPQQLWLGRYLGGGSRDGNYRGTSLIRKRHPP